MRLQCAKEEGHVKEVEARLQLALNYVRKLMDDLK